MQCCGLMNRKLAQKTAISARPRAAIIGDRQWIRRAQDFSRDLWVQCGWLGWLGIGHAASFARGLPVFPPPPLF